MGVIECWIGTRDWLKGAEMGGEGSGEGGVVCSGKKGAGGCVVGEISELLCTGIVGKDTDVGDGAGGVEGGLGLRMMWIPLVLEGVVVVGTEEGEGGVGGK